MNKLISRSSTKLRLVNVFFGAVILGCTTALTFANTFDIAAELINKGDFSAGLKILRPLALRGDASSQYFLGSLYDHGDGVPKDSKEAIRWYRLAADQGLADAQFNLGVSYDRGDGVPKDTKEAARWYRLAADQGLAEAQFNLGNRYSEGDGVPKDLKEAVRWYRLAANRYQRAASFVSFGTPSPSEYFAPRLN